MAVYDTKKLKLQSYQSHEWMYTQNELTNFIYLAFKHPLSRKVIHLNELSIKDN